MQRDRLLTHLLLLCLIAGLGLFLLSRRERLRQPSPAPLVDPSTSVRSNNPAPFPSAPQDPGIPAKTGSTATTPSAAAEPPREPGRLVVHLEITPPDVPFKGTVLVLAKPTGAIDGQRDLDGEAETIFDAIPGGPKVIVILPHAASIGPAYVETFVASASSTTAVVPLSKGKGLEGVVVDLQGRPVEKAEVMVDLKLGYTLPRDLTGVSAAYTNVSTDGTTWSFFAVLGMVGRSVLTDAEGRFRIENTGMRPLEVSAKTQTSRSLKQTVIPGAPVRLVVQR